MIERWLKNKKLYYLLLLCSLCMIGLWGCKWGTNKPTDKDNESNVTNSVSQSETSQSETRPTITPTVEPTKASDNNVTPTPIVTANQGSEEGFDGLTNYKHFQDAFFDYDFTYTRKGTDPYNQIIKVEGNYDLDLDNKEDSIILNLDYTKEDSTIEVNGISFDFHIDTYMEGEVKLVDLDKNDNYIEIACYDAGPSADDIYIFFRYDGKSIKEIGRLPITSYTNEAGRLVSIFDVSWQFEPPFCSGWYDIVDNELQYSANSIEEYKGKIYDYKGGYAFFIPMEEQPKDLDWSILNWEMENGKEYKPDKVKIIDVWHQNYYYVEFSSGETGLLYFWIGD